MSDSTQMTIDDIIRFGRIVETTEEIKKYIEDSNHGLSQVCTGYTRTHYIIIINKQDTTDGKTDGKE